MSRKAQMRFRCWHVSCSGVYIIYIYIYMLIWGHRYSCCTYEHSCCAIQYTHQDTRNQARMQNHNTINMCYSPMPAEAQHGHPHSSTFLRIMLLRPKPPRKHVQVGGLIIHGCFGLMPCNLIRTLLSWRPRSRNHPLPTVSGQ